MQTIHKFLVPMLSYSQILMPKDSEILAIQLQDEQPQIWALVEPSNDKVFRKFRMFGTGEPIIDHGTSLVYVGTVQYYGGVWHIFEEGE